MYSPAPVQESSNQSSRLVPPIDRFAGGFPWGWFDFNHPSWWSPLASRSRHTPGQPDGWIWDEYHLERCREASRLLYQDDDHAGGLINTLVTYTGGKGIPWKGCRRKGYEQSGDSGATEDDQPEDVKRLQLVFDLYNDRTIIRSRQIEHARRRLRDGESIRRLFRGKQGQLPQRRWVEPEEIAAPPGMTSDPRVSFGVLCPAGDPQKVLGYWVCNPKNHADGCAVRAAGADEGEFKGLCEELGLTVGAGVILFSKYGTDATVKRGLPLLFASESTLRSASVLLDNLLETSKEQSRIAWLAQHKNATLDAVRNFSDALAAESGLETLKFQSGELIATPTITHGPGIREIRTNENTTYAPGPGNPGSPNFLMVKDAAIRKACSRSAVPFHMIGMDTSDANYAGIKEAGSPFVVARETDLAILADDERAEAREVIRLACESGLVPSEPDDLDAEITPPPVAIKSELESEQVASIRQRDKVLSPQQRIRQNGADPKHVVADIQSWPFSDGSEPAMGNAPPPTGGPDEGGPVPSGGAGFGRLDPRRMKLGNLESKDDSGHQHKGKGPGGGQFTKSGGSGADLDTAGKSKNAARRLGGNLAALASHVRSGRSTGEESATRADAHLAHADRVITSYYRDAHRSVRTKLAQEFGPEVLRTPEYRAVRDAFASVNDETLDHLSDIRKRKDQMFGEHAAGDSTAVGTHLGGHVDAIDTMVDSFARSHLHHQKRIDDAITALLKSKGSKGVPSQYYESRNDTGLTSED